MPAWLAARLDPGAGAATGLRLSGLELPVLSLAQDGPVFDDNDGPGDEGDILKRIAGDDDRIGQLSRLKRTQLVAETGRFRADTGRRLNHLVRRIAPIEPDLELVLVEDSDLTLILSVDIGPDIVPPGAG